MKTFIAILGRQPEISLAELCALYGEARLVAANVAELKLAEAPDINRLGGTMKIAEKIEIKLDEFLAAIPGDGKVTIGVSDLGPRAAARSAGQEAMTIKKKLVRLGRSVRVVPNQTAVLSNATSLHNHLTAENKIEILKLGKDYYRLVGLSNIESYARRDQKRPARDAKVGMLPPKLAQILINLCGNLKPGSRLLDPFCGTGVVIQEAVLMGYAGYGTDVSERMVEYSRRNLEWLQRSTKASDCSPSRHAPGRSGQVLWSGKTGSDALECPAVFEVGDATSYQWEQPIAAVACETYLGPPMSQIPPEIKLRSAKEECQSIILGFLKNLSTQIKSGTPVVIAVPAWLRNSGEYQGLNILDEIEKLRYNVYSFKKNGADRLLYHRDGQVVAREIIVLRKK